MVGNAVVAARFRQLSSDRFAALKAQLFDLDAAGPRSIAEVRRENRRKEGHRDEDDEDGAGLEEDADLSFEPSTEPQALADLEATQKAVAVAVLWSKEGITPGSRRFGLSWSFHVPFLDPVLASLKHAAKVVLSSGEKSVRVPITLELRGTNHTPLIASVEAVDLSLSADVAVGASGTENEEYRSSLPVNRGMRWVGKTSYKDVTLQPNVTQKFNFSVIASKCGVFDIGRFKLSIVDAQSNTKESGSSILDKQSLVEVVPERTR